MRDFTPHWSYERVDDTRCRASVHNGGRDVGFHQCLRKPLEGEKYCKQHSPEAETARREAGERRYKEQQEADHKSRVKNAVSLLREAGYTVYPPGSRP